MLLLFISYELILKDKKEKKCPCKLLELLKMTFVLYGSHY